MAEIGQVERLLLGGHRDMEGLLLALADWGQELRMIARESEAAGG